MKNTDTIFYITANKGFTQQPTLNVMIQQLEGEGFKLSLGRKKDKSTFDHVRVDLIQKTYSTYYLNQTLLHEVEVLNAFTDWSKINQLIETKATK